MNAAALRQFCGRSVRLYFQPAAAAVRWCGRLLARDDRGPRDTRPEPAAGRRNPPSPHVRRAA